MTSLANPLPVDEKTLFHLASVTKTFTATALMRLAAEGRVDLHAPVRRYEYRLDLAPGQAEFAERIGGVCRSVWNTALEQRRTYRRREAWIGYHEQARQLAEAKGEFAWLAEVPGHCLQQTLIDLDQACGLHGT
ncbi:serine hydrolase [Nonomuraea sp. NPDC050691]|uniref:serine hydrolase n=1 Tax=Nonomuraea sp. NPDC050691 TaxID=3155661 RepID=UPI0033E3C33C